MHDELLKRKIKSRGVGGWGGAFIRDRKRCGVRGGGEGGGSVCGRNGGGGAREKLTHPRDKGGGYRGWGLPGEVGG